MCQKFLPSLTLFFWVNFRTLCLCWCYYFPPRSLGSLTQNECGDDTNNESSSSSSCHDLTGCWSWRLHRRLVCFTSAPTATTTIAARNRSFESVWNKRGNYGWQQLDYTFEYFLAHLFTLVAVDPKVAITRGLRVEGGRARRGKKNKRSWKHASPIMNGG